MREVYHSSQLQMNLRSLMVSKNCSPGLLLSTPNPNNLVFILFFSFFFLSFYLFIFNLSFDSFFVYLPFFFTRLLIIGFSVTRKWSGGIIENRIGRRFEPRRRIGEKSREDYLSPNYTQQQVQTTKGFVTNKYINN